MDLAQCCLLSVVNGIDVACLVCKYKQEVLNNEKPGRFYHDGIIGGHRNRWHIIGHCRAEFYRVAPKPGIYHQCAAYHICHA
jgi:hypothetical protein